MVHVSLVERELFDDDYKKPRFKKKKSVKEKFGKGYCDKPGIHVNIKLRVNHGNYGYKKYKHKS